MSDGWVLGGGKPTPPAGPLACVELNSAIGKRDLYLRENSTDAGAIKQVFEEQQYAVAHLFRWAEISEFLARKQRAGETPLIIDAGANIGAATVYFAVHFPNARIIAIEPERGNFDVLQKNVEGLNVRCVQAALAGAPGRAKIVDPGDGQWGFRTAIAAGKDVRENDLACVTIADIYAQEVKPGVFPFLVKMDIEGAESDVFTGDVSWIKQTPLFMIELHDWLMPKAGTASGFLKTIAHEPRDFLIRGENIYSIAHQLG